MRCAACGTETPSEAVFCPKCGERLKNDPTALAQSAGAGASPADKFREAANAMSGDGPAEQSLWTGNYSGRAMIGAWILAAVVEAAALGFAIWLRNRNGWIGFAIISALVWVLPVLVLVYRKLSVKYALTSLRLIHERGILRRVIDRIEVIDIDDVTCEQGLVERALGVGSVRIQSSDRTHPELLLIGIENVREVAELIDDTRRKERHRRGLHIEAV